MPAAVSDHAVDLTEACYVYRPSNPDAPQSSGQQRPKKRRKTVHLAEEDDHPNSVQASSSGYAFFTSLLDGKETVENVTLRAEEYEAVWKVKEQHIETVLREANTATVNRIFEFISTTEPPASTAPIPTGLVTAGLATSSSGSIFAAVEAEAKGLEGCVVIPVPASDCPNLKTALKAIIRNGTTRETGDGDEEILPSSKEGPRLLNYDLQALADIVKRKKIDRCVLFFQNSEALDGMVLSELIDVLSSWQDRIPFLLLMEIAVSIDLFQEKIPRSAVRRLQGTTFESKSASDILDIMFRAATSADESNSLWLGPAASKLLLDRQTEHIQSAKGFISMLKYMYMTHFYTNPLTVLLSEEKTPTLQIEHYDAIRRLPSFKRYIQDLIDSRQNKQAQSLLKDNKVLQKEIPIMLSRSRTALRGLSDALQALRRIHDCSATKQSLTWSTLYIKALSGDLADSALLRDLLLSVRKFTSDKMEALLESLSSIESLDLGSAVSDLAKLTKKSTSDETPSSSPAPTSKPTPPKKVATARSSDATTTTTTTPLRSEWDTQTNSTVRTTVISKKIALTRQKAELSPWDAAYSKFVTRIDLLLKNFFASHLLSLTQKPPPSTTTSTTTTTTTTSSATATASSLPLSELLIFNSPKPIAAAFSGAPRAALERALSKPSDYLACECCAVEEGRLTGTAPATSLVYQLVAEAGALINVEDLWRAYGAIVENGDEAEEGKEGNEGEGEDVKMALFHRALAELRYLGIVRASRKKADHVLKVRWKGL